MTVGEVTRQYQAALEQRRSTLELLDGVVGADDIRADLDAEVDRAAAQLNAVWLEHAYA